MNFYTSGRLCLNESVTKFQKRKTRAQAASLYFILKKNIQTFNPNEIILVIIIGQSLFKNP